MCLCLCGGDQELTEGTEVMAFISFKLVKLYLDSECAHAQGGKVNIFFFFFKPLILVSRGRIMSVFLLWTVGLFSVLLPNLSRSH